MANNRVSIVIVTHNSLPSLEFCLRALKAGLGGIDHELIFVDNNSRDDSIDVAARYFPEARSILNRRNAGFAAACNAGSKIATGRFLLFLNPDVVVEPEAVGNLVTVLSAVRKVGVVGARMVSPDGGFQPSCRRLPTIYNLRFSRGSILSRLFGRASVYTLGDFAETTEVPAIAGSMMMIRRGLFTMVGGFDERFFMYMEDTDLCARLRSAGCHNLYVPSARAMHDWGRGSNEGRLKRNWYHHCSVWKYFLKHLPNGFSLLILPVMLSLNFLVSSLIPNLQGNKPVGGPERTGEE